jgi:Fur family ferric uptake transcriptional regulator
VTNPSHKPPHGASPQTAVPLCSVFRRHLRSLDLKYTTERADILDAVVRMDRVFEADELLTRMQAESDRRSSDRSHQVSKATIYRTLKLLVDAGILAEVPLNRERTHYQLVYGKPATDFAMCVQTGAKIEFSDPRVAELCARILREMGWEPAGHRLQLYGTSPAATRPGPESSNTISRPPGA